MNTEKKYGFSEIRDYILNKLPEHEKLTLDEQINSDTYLNALYNELDRIRPQLIEIDKMKLTDNQNEQTKKLVFNMISRPEPAAGQIWEIRTNYFALILSVTDNEFIHSILVTHNHEVTGNKDLICTEADVSALPIAIHTNHLFTVLNKDLKTYRGKAEPLTFDIVQKLLTGETPELPVNCKYGYGIEHEEVDTWNAFAEEILEEYHQAALEEYEAEAEVTNDDQNSTALIFKLPELMKEEQKTGYSLAAASDYSDVTDDVELVDSETVLIVYTVKKNPYSLLLKIFASEITGVLNDFCIKQAGSELLHISQINQTGDEFDVLINDADVVSKLITAGFEIEFHGKRFEVRIQG